MIAADSEMESHDSVAKSITDERPFVSIVVPCRNERRFIVDCLDSILRTDYPPDRLEVLVVDGASDDGTRILLSEYSAREARVKWLDNARQTTPVALNIGIQNALGEILMIMGAHCKYPHDYISKLVGWLEHSAADNVGGICRTLAGADSQMASAIAFALSHPFGVGNSYFRIGVSKPKWVDTVPFGCYRINVFSRIGLFDEELVRNQDDELNQRLLKSGGRILIVPDVVSEYYARDTLNKVARMHYQYGYFKPLVARKIGRVGTWRQLVPVAFLLSLAVTLVLAPWIEIARWAFLGIVGTYLAALLAAIVTSMSHNGFETSVLLGAVFPVVHFSYAWGSLKGIIKFVIRQSPSGAIAEIRVSR
jgi:glycosyltransferase involved in cell wall biosynthesis